MIFKTTWKSAGSLSAPLTLRLSFILYSLFQKAHEILVFSVRSGENVVILTADDQGFSIIRYVVSHENGYLLALCQPKGEFEFGLGPSSLRKLIVFSTTTWQIAAEYEYKLLETLFLSEVSVFFLIRGGGRRQAKSAKIIPKYFIF